MTVLELELASVALGKDPKFADAHNLSVLSTIYYTAYILITFQHEGHEHTGECFGGKRSSRIPYLETRGVKRDLYTTEKKEETDNINNPVISASVNTVRAVSDFGSAPRKSPCQRTSQVVRVRH